VSKFFFLIVASALLAVAAVAQQPPSPAPSPLVTTSSPAPTPAATASPTATATPAYRFVYLPTPSPGTTPFPGPHPPQILEIDLNDQTIVTPGELRVRVLTSVDVVSVVARAVGREIALPRVQAGEFGGSYQLPQVPSFLSGQTFDVDFVAAVADGRISTITLPLGLK
jgi:hypothetical protein